jgi:predicted dehydrogenase
LKPKPKLNAALIGHRFMGRAHSHALHDLPMFFDVPFEVVRHTLCGRGDDLEEAASRLGWAQTSRQWEEVVANPEIGLVIVTAPGNLHCEIAEAAAGAGKHLLCEKPLANTDAEARRMLQAVQEAGVSHCVNFNYRKLPAVALAKRLVSEGRLGRLLFFRATYFQDWTLLPGLPYLWRFDKEIAGAGSMADKGSHVVDLARYLCGEFAEVAATADIFVKERQGRAVTTDDAAAFLARFANGAMGLFGTNRMSAGHKNALSFEVNGTEGSVIFDLERLNELQVYLSGEGEVSGFRTVMVTDAAHHEYVGHWWPAGHVLGWEHGFVHQYADFLEAIGTGSAASPDFGDGWKAQQVLEAVATAAAERRWVAIASE